MRIPMIGTAALAILLPVLEGASLDAQEQLGGERPEGVLYFFLTPEAERAPEAARRAVEFLARQRGRVRLRTVLLVRDYGALGRLSGMEPIYQALKTLGETRPLDIPLHDPEGLRLAEKWKISAVPAFVLVRGKRAHRAIGAAVDLTDLWECRR